MPVSEAEVVEALRPVEDPELHRSIVDLNMVRGVQIAGDKVEVKIALTVPGCPLEGEITRRVDEAVVALDGVSAVALDFTVMTDDEREVLRRKFARRSRRDRREPASTWSRRGSGDPVRRSVVEDTRAADRVGQGRRRASPRSRPTSVSHWPTAVIRSPWSTRMCGASRSLGCWAWIDHRW